LKANYKIVFVKSAIKDLKTLNKTLVKRIITSIELLSKNPRPRNSKKLTGNNENLWRLRVGEYRIVYHVSDQVKIVSIRRIRHRKDVYR
jgi:mRNA interferase RelE/StbE